MASPSRTSNRLRAFLALGGLIVSFQMASARQPDSVVTDYVPLPGPYGADTYIAKGSAPKASESSSDEFLLRIGGFLGGGDGSYHASPLVLGGSLDVRAARYFGAEAYAFYGTYLTNNIVWPSHRDQSGGMFSLKTQVPFTFGPFLWTPKLGAGTGSWNAGYQSFQGPFLEVGVEIETSALGVHADYYRGIGGTITQTTVLTMQSDNGPSSFASENSRGSIFEQYRAGIFFKVAKEMRLGVDVIQSHWVGVNHTQALIPFQLDF